MAISGFKGVDIKVSLTDYLFFFSFLTDSNAIARTPVRTASSVVILSPVPMPSKDLPTEGELLVRVVRRRTMRLMQNLEICRIALTGWRI